MVTVPKEQLGGTGQQKLSKPKESIHRFQWDIYRTDSAVT